MLSTHFETQLKRMAPVPLILWLCFNLSIGILIFMAYQFKPASLPEVINAELYQHIFIAISVLLAAISLIARTFMLSDERAKKIFAEPVDLKSLAIVKEQQDEARLKELEAIPSRERPLLVIMRWFFIATVLQSALHEAIAILGFVLAMITGRPELILPFAGAAFALNFLAFPAMRRAVEHFSGMVRAA